MTNKFKAAKGNKKAAPVKETVMTNDEKLDQIHKMKADYSAKMEVLIENIGVKLLDLHDRYRGVSGVVDVIKAGELAGYKLALSEIEDVCGHAQQTIEDIFTEFYLQMPKETAQELVVGQYDWANSFLDLFVNSDFVDQMDDWLDIVKELVDCNIAQEVWEHLRRLPEFHDMVLTEVTTIEESIVCEASE